MKMRIVYDVKENTDLTDQEIIKNIPTDLDPISTKDVKIRNYVIRYFIHKEEIVATYLKTFIKEQSSLLTDVDLYNLYKTYKDKSFIAYVDGNNKDYSKYREYAEILKSEILERCEAEC